MWSSSKVDRAVFLPLTAKTFTVLALHHLAACFMNSTIYELDATVRVTGCIVTLSGTVLGLRC